MEFDLDPLDDLFPGGAAKNARAGGKFQPKIKARPRKTSSVSVPSSQTFVATATISQPSQNNEVSNNNSNISELVNPSLEYATLSENMGPIFGQSSDATLDNNTGHDNSCVGKTKGENVDLYIGLDSFDDFHLQNTTLDPQNTTLEVNASSSSPREVQMNVQQENGTTTLDDRLTHGEATISANDGDFHIENRQFDTQESEAYACLDTLDIMSAPATNSGRRNGKFQPVPKAQEYKEKRSGAVPDVGEAVESIYWGDDNTTQWNPSRTEYMNQDDGSSPAYPPPLTDDLDFSANIYFNESIPSDPTFDHAINEEGNQTNFKEIHQQDASFSERQLEGVPEMPEAETGRSSRRQRKRKNEYQLVDESDDEVPNDADATTDFINEENNADMEYREENEAPKKKRVRKNSKNSVVADKEKKTVRKRKKKGNEEESVKSKEEAPPPKKFSHSTRRNRRRIVDKTLLETPEEEINFKKLKIRDLIIYAEHKERTEKKELTTSQTPTTNPSDANSSAKRYNEEDGFGWEPQDREYDEEEQENHNVEETSTYFNYQTHMEKTPVARWSKQDTELFYEGIRQFGTDLSMIQQLFPDRTRRQIKLKYKKEERREPFRLHEAICNRSSDNSQFELVIERLKKIADEEDKLNANMDGSDGLIGDEADEAALEANVQKELAKTDKVEEGEEVQDIEAADGPAAHSPVKSGDDDDNSEDDMFRWSQYNSEF